MVATALLFALSGLVASADEPAPYPSPDRPGEVQPARRWDIEHLALSVDIDLDEGRIEGRTVHRIKPLPRPSRRLRLHQVALDITSVLVDGQPATYELGADWIEIPVTPGVPHEVTIAYSAAPQLGMHFRRPGQDSATYREVWTQGENDDHRHWFPSWDHPTDRFTVSTDVTVPSDLVVVANGALTDKTEVDAGRTRWSFELEQRIVNYLVVVAAGEYQVFEHEGTRVPVQSFVHDALPASAAAGLDTAAPMLPWFDQVLGTPYPYPEYRQVAVQSFMYGGMENASTTVLAGRLVVDDAWDDPRRTESVVAHELAHQWFGDLLTCYGWRELWLNEGFATYWTNRWMEHRYGPSYAALRRAGAMRSARGQKHPMALRAWSARPGDGQPSHNVYNRGSTVLRMLEVYLGRDTFDAGIRRYVAEHADSLVETADLRRSMEDVSGEHLGWLFDQWVHRPGSPKVEVRHAWRPAEGDNDGQIEVVLEQASDGPSWVFPLTVEIGHAGGSERHTLWVDDRVTKLVIDAAAPPAWVLADPDQGVIARWTQHQTTDQWLAIMERSPSWDARLVALQALAAEEDGDPESFAQAAAGWVRDGSLDRGLRRAAAEALGKRVSPASAKALLELSGVQPPRVRAAVMASLGKQQDSGEIRELLQRTTRSDMDPRVRSSALAALAKHDEDEATRAARGLLRADAPVRVAALTHLGQHGTKKDLRRLLPHLRQDAERWPRQTAANAIWNLASRFSQDEDIGEQASRSIEPLLDSTDVRIREQAIRILAEIGDERAARRLQAYAAQTRLPSHRERALDAARDIRTAHTKPSSPPSPDDLERVQERIEALQQRLDDLEKRR